MINLNKLNWYDYINELNQNSNADKKILGSRAKPLITLKILLKV